MKSNTENHHFTVVIPTRERCDTLEHALHTCVIQDYDNLEILVSDNFSQDRTREVVESYKDLRIRYINTGKRLSMTGNYEFALSHVKPKGYIIYIGDDDGLLPNAIRDINTAITQTNAQVLRWDIPSFAWPNLTNNSASHLSIPCLGRGTTIQNSEITIQNVLSFKTPYQSLPMMYMYSSVAYEVIKRIKELSGRFYHSLGGDVYSGFAIAGAVNNFMNSRRPYAIAGCSHHSIGASMSCTTSPDAARTFFSEDNVPFHSSLVISRSINVAIIESYFQARDHLPYFQHFTLDMKQLLLKMMEEAASQPLENYVQIKDTVLSIGQMHNIPNAARRAIANNPKRNPNSRRTPTIRNLGRGSLMVARQLINDLRKGSIYLDCSSLNVKNIYDASLLCGHILKLSDMKYLGYSAILKSSLTYIRKLIVPGEKSRTEVGCAVEKYDSEVK